MMGRGVTTAAVVWLLLLGAAPARSEEGRAIRVSPGTIKIGLFYGGQTIDVRATVPKGVEAVFEISGKRADLPLKIKGKKGGVLWMNVGEVTYAAVPSLFMIRSAKPLEALASEAALERLGIGYRALRTALVKDGDETARAHIGELIELKESEGLFSVETTGVEVVDKGAEGREVHAAFFLPAKAPVGEYAIEVFAFKDNAGSLLGSARVTLGYADATAFIVSLAKNHGLLYGCLAVLIAVLAGLFIGLIFKGKAGAH
jgi:uncharacterized protein (TIGR02186 family)